MPALSLQERAQRGRRLILLGALINTILALVKIAGGILGRSHALIADGIESALDVFSSSLMWGAIKYAERPPDEDHPYGHGRMESMAAAVGASFLIFAGFAVAWNSVREIIAFHSAPNASHVPSPMTLGVLVLTIVLKEFLFRVLHTQGKKLGSKAMETDALHHRSDAMTSIAAGIGITVAVIGGAAWASADDWAALFSCVLIVFNGVKMLKSSAGDMLDEQADPETRDAIRGIATSVPGVTSIEKCRVRRSGLVRIADIHVRVDGDRTVREGHEIAHLVADALKDAHDLRLSDVTVHIEPEA